MKIILWTVLVCALIGAYVIWRPHLVKMFPNFYAKIGPIETALFLNSETILWARTKTAVGILLTGLTAAGQIDFTPLMVLVPQEYQWWAQFAIQMLPLAISAVGMMDEWLRRGTTLPLSVVAIPEAVKQEPAVQEAITDIHATQAATVATAAVVADARAS